MVSGSNRLPVTAPNVRFPRTKKSPPVTAGRRFFICAFAREAIYNRTGVWYTTGRNSLFQEESI